MGLAEPGQPKGEQLYAVVVPNMDLIRKRKIVNVGDILRFELEGLSRSALPAHQRVLGYHISFELLPRTTTQDIKRQEVEDLARARQHRAQHGAPLSSEDEPWLGSPHAAPVVAVIQSRATSGARVWADANLELDLGLDSMDRVELFAELEVRLGVCVSRARGGRDFHGPPSGRRPDPIRRSSSSEQ